MGISDKFDKFWIYIDKFWISYLSWYLHIFLLYLIQKKKKKKQQKKTKKKTHTHKKKKKKKKKKTQQIRLHVKCFESLWMSIKQCRPWSVSTLLAQAFRPNTQGKYSNLIKSTTSAAPEILNPLLINHGYVPLISCTDSISSKKYIALRKETKNINNDKEFSFRLTSSREIVFGPYAKSENLIRKQSGSVWSRCNNNNNNNNNNNSNNNIHN